MPHAFTIARCFLCRKRISRIDYGMPSPHPHTTVVRRYVVPVRGDMTCSARLILMIASMWFVLIGAGSGALASHHACSCSEMEHDHASESLATAAHDDVARTHDAHARHDDCSCACGAESLLDCECEIKPYDSMPTPDAMLSSASTSIVGLVPLRPAGPTRRAPAEFSPDRPPGNWLYSRPPPISRHILHRKLLL